MLVGNGVWGGSAGGWGAWTGSNDGANIDAYTSAMLGVTSPKSGIQMATGKVLLVLTGWSGAQSLYAVAGTVSGNSISYGNPALVAVDGIVTQASVCQMTTDTALIAYRARSSSTSAYCNVVTSGGTTVSVGPQSADFSGGYGCTDSSLAALNSTTALLTWSRPSSVFGCIAVISGTSVSGIYSSQGLDMSYSSSGYSSDVVALSSTSALLFYGTSSGLCCQMLSISGTSLSRGNCSVDASLSVVTGTAKSIRAAKISSTKAVVHAVCSDKNYIVVVDVGSGSPVFGTPSSLPATYNCADIAFSATASGGVAVTSNGPQLGFGYGIQGATVAVGAAVTLKTGGSGAPSIVPIAETGQFVAGYGYNGALSVGSAVLNP